MHRELPHGFCEIFVQLGLLVLARCIGVSWGQRRGRNDKWRGGALEVGGTGPAGVRVLRRHSESSVYIAIGTLCIERLGCVCVGSELKYSPLSKGKVSRRV